MEAQSKPQPLCPLATKKAQEDLGIITTLLLTPGNGTSSPKSFYAHFLMRMNVVYTNKLPTAGVSVTDKLNLYINPDFFNSLDVEQKKELIEHEVEHIIYKHPLRAKDYIGDGYNSNTHKLFNIASDAYINNDKPHLTKDLGVTYDRLNKELKQLGSKDTVGPENPSEVTYEILKRNQLEADGKGGCQTSDDHSTWDESTENREIADAIIKDAANKAQAATGVGNMPEGILREISNMNKATVNWKRELRQFFVHSLKYDFERTRTRRNRRDIHNGDLIQMPGRRKKPQLSVAVCVDSSGSVCDDAFAQFFAEIGAIADMGVEITVLDADCEVQSIYKYDKTKKVERTGRGGTAYGPAINKAKELGVDGIIYFGDFDCADTPTDPKIPFLWAGVGNQPAPASFGKVVRVTTDHHRGR